MEGGVMVTDDEELYHIALSIRAHGWTRNLPKNNLVTGVKSDSHFEEAFKFVLPGYNLRPLEMSGAIGREQLKKVPMIVENRRKNAEIFKEVIKPFDWIIPQREVERSSWFGFSMVIDPQSNYKRKDLLSIFDKNGIEYRPIVAGNFAKNEVIKFFNYSIHGRLTNADIIDEAGLFVGNHHYNMDKEFEVLKRVLNQIN
jgi:CDP-6-deoxy-D-xylo-4-hexulose-3-dehydrase